MIFSDHCHHFLVGRGLFLWNRSVVSFGWDCRELSESSFSILKGSSMRRPKWIFLNSFSSETLGRGECPMMTMISVCCALLSQYTTPYAAIGLKEQAD